MMESLLLLECRGVSTESARSQLITTLADLNAVDGTGTEQGFTYSYQVADITPGLVVSCNTQTNTCTTVSSGGSSG
jgi:hypothetical protein